MYAVFFFLQDSGSFFSAFDLLSAVFFGLLLYYLASYSLSALSFISVDFQLSFMNAVSFCIIFSAIFSLTCGLEVLAILPFFSSSHFAVGNGIVKSLHAAGHEITVFHLSRRKLQHQSIMTSSTLHQIQCIRQKVKKYFFNVYNIVQCSTLSQMLNFVAIQAC